MIEEIIDGIWEDISKRVGYALTGLHGREAIKRSWRVIIHKAIDGSKSSQAMLEETAVMER